MDWEQTKENCVPVRQGRSKAALQELADPASETLEAKRRELWAEVVEYQGDDPLEAWQRYIKWMQEYGVGGGKADLLKVLETCTKELQRQDRYANDIRFLRIWIQYADCLPDPGDVFLFLKEKGIGLGFALFYEAYATYFELRGNFPSADAVYADGVQRGAKPLERLKQKHVAFQQRMAQRIQRRIQDEQVTGPPPPEPARSSLATIGQRPASRRPQAQQSHSLFGAEAPQANALLFGTRAGQQDQRGMRAAVDVLADEDPENGSMGLPGYSSMPQVNNLRELKPYGVIRKENLDRPVAWNQAASQSSGPQAAGGRGGGLDIFTDEEFQDGSEEIPGAQQMGRSAAPSAPGPAASSGHPLLLAAASAPGVPPGMDALMWSLAPPPMLLRSSIQPGPTQAPSNPLFAAAMGRNEIPSAPVIGWAAPVVSADSTGPPEPRVAYSLPGPQTLGSAPRCAGAAESGAQPGLPAIAQKPKSGQGDEEDPGVPGSSSEDDEVSYEEQRAAAWFRRNPAFLPVESGAPSATCCGGGTGSCSTRDGSDLYGSSISFRPAASYRENAPHAAAQVQAPGMPVRSAIAQQSDPWGCICADAPGRHVPFGQVPPLEGRAPPPPASENEAGASRAEDRVSGAQPEAPAPRRPLEDAALASGGLLAHLNPQGGSAGCAPAGPQHTSTAPAAVESCRASFRECDRQSDMQPTVTISTRRAFDLMNSLFSEDLSHQQPRRQADGRGSSGAEAEAEGAKGRAIPPQPSWRTAAPDLGAAQPQQSAMMPPPPPRPPAPTVAPAACAEPTVTLHTRLAFDALNDMFSDTLPHEEARKLGRRGGGEGATTTSTKPITSLDVCRLANAGRASGPSQAGHSGRPAAFGSTFGGPPFSGAPLGPGGTNPGSSLAIHEDTFFLGSATETVSGDRTGGGGPGGALQSTSAPGIYEDTEFIPRGPPRGAQGLASVPVLPDGAFIMEDTEFLTRPQAAHVAAVASGFDASGRARAQNADDLSCAAAASQSRLQACCGPKPCATGRPGVLGVARDTM